MQVQGFMKKYQGKILQDDGAYKSQEFINFAKDFRSVIKDLADTIGATIESWNVGHYYVSGFLEKEGKYIYFYYNEPRHMPIDLLRSDAHMGILYRTAKGSKDYTGGCNQFCNLLDFPSATKRFFERQCAKVA